ncbi:MAG TPA: DUF58 domain-containing protein [Microbacterium sp.]|uniref:DUF58 domain-containing protein n=1 Tax=Microbacterium sp. TaxID=51671 RepID=UPI002B48EDD3|nr:DUF58 domain-containing protein [Microbacterium sp.]HKT56423.1 DUF58 domain-containing protein [Microbacterium sp.]
MFVTGRLTALVAAGAVPLVLLTVAGVNPWAVFGGWLVLCAALVAVDAAAAPSPRLLHIIRSAPARTRLGVPVETTITVRNTGARTLHGRLRDAWQPTAGAPAARARLRVDPGATQTLVVPLLPRRRGELRSEFVVVRSVGPLGLAGRQRRIVEPAAVRVLPPFASRRHLASRIARLNELDGATSVQVRGQGTEFDSLRPYVRGDDVRSIDWRATARAGATMLRTWRPERDRHVVILIDTGRTSAARVGDGVRLDAAFEASLLLAALAQHAGDHVHLLAFDRLVRARVSRVDGPTLLPAMVDALAPVEPSLLDTDWDAAFAAIRALGVRPSLIVLLTAQDEPEASRGFLSALPSLAAHTTVLVGTATDVATEAEAAAPPVDADDVYRHAAAARTVSDARRVAGAIDRAGAEPVAADPNTLPTRIADRYLALKAHGRL